jgi:hypothetical protein
MRRWLSAAFCAAWVLLCAGLAVAQTDEIQVYTGDIVAPGTFGLTLHNNYIAEGRKTPDFAGGIVPNHSWNGVPEFAYGVTDWLELGTYLPVYTLTNGKFELDSVKLRALFVAPHNDDRTFFYGVNFELSWNAKHWDQSRNTGEIRPIIGWRAGPVDIVVNPILDTAFDGFKNLDFAPAERIDYNFSKTWAVALEHYADFGPLRGFLPANQQDQSLFAVVDYSSKVNVEFGVGHGFAGGGDPLVIKLMLSFDL